ncbi:hypothetical protein D3C71_1817290 [compost metagenome]
MAPRPPLIKMAPGFMAAKRSALTMFRVLSDKGSIATTKSDWASKSGSGTCAALPCSSGAWAAMSTDLRAW